MNIRDRVKDFRRVPASELRPNPKNWRVDVAVKRWETLTSRKAELVPSVKGET